MGYKQKHLDAVRKAAYRCASMDEMVRSTRMKPHRIYHLALILGIDLADKRPLSKKVRVRPKKAQPPEEHLEQVVVRAPEPSSVVIEELRGLFRKANELGMNESEDMELVLAREYHVRRQRGKIPVEQAASFYRFYGAVEGRQHLYTFGEVAAAAGLSERQVLMLVGSVGLELFAIDARWRDALNESVARGLKSSYASRVVGCSVRLVQKELSRRPALHARWIAARELVRSRAHHGGLVSVLMGRAQLLADEAGFAGQKTIEHLQQFPRRRRSVDEVYSFYSAYDDAVQSGEKRNIRKLARRVGFVGNEHLERIMERVGLELLGGECSRTARLSEDERAAVLRARFMNISQDDVAYFLGLARSTVYEVVRKAKTRRRKKLNRKKQSGIWIGDEHINMGYRHASEIFEARDAGMDMEQIIEYSGRPHSQVAQVLAHSEEISQRVAGTLQMLYNNPRIRVPYRSDECVFSDGH